MVLELTPDVRAKIQEQIDAGLYPDANTVVRVAVTLLDAQQRRLDAALQVGLDQLDRGETVEWTPELHDEIVARAIERAQRGERPDPDVLS